MDNQISEVLPLFPKPLTISKVIAPLKYKRAIVKTIEELGSIEPIAVDPRTGSDEIIVVQRKNKLEELRNTLNTYISALDLDNTETSSKVKIGQSEDDVINYLDHTINEKSSKINEIIQRNSEITDRLSELSSIMELLEKFDILDISETSLLKDTQFVKTFIGTVFPAQLQRLKWEIDEITQNRFLLIEHQIDKENTLLLLSVLDSDAEATSDKLKSFSFSEVVIPKDLDLDGLNQNDCQAEYEQLTEEQKSLTVEMTDLSKTIGVDLIAANEVLNIELQRIEIEQKMRRTQTTCVLWAWIPDELQDTFRLKINEATENNVFDMDFRKGDFDPTLIPSRVENTEFMQPMRGLVTAFGTPGLKEIDPFKFVLILFPILFGIMFADIGHGLLLLAAGAIFKKKREKLTEIPTGIAAYAYGGANLMMIMGTTAAIMGVLLNSFFGDETFLIYVWASITGNQIQIENATTALSGMIPTWDLFFYTTESNGHVEIHRNYVAFLVFSFAIGAVVILLGLLLNLYQLYYYRHSEADFRAATTLFLTYFSIILTAIFAVAFPSASWLVTLGVILIVGFIFATLTIEAKAHGIDGLMLGVDHILALMSNTFSFGRLLAMNTIHFVLATLPFLFIDIGRSAADKKELGYVFNHYLDLDQWPMAEPSMFLLWFLGAFVGSLIVVPVETTFSTLQALRLNWVEFFGKFYKGTGLEFNPVKINRLHTIEE